MASVGSAFMVVNGIYQLAPLHFAEVTWKLSSGLAETVAPELREFFRCLVSAHEEASVFCVLFPLCSGRVRARRGEFKPTKP